MLGTCSSLTLAHSKSEVMARPSPAGARFLQSSVGLSWFYSVFCDLVTCSRGTDSSGQKDEEAVQREQPAESDVVGVN